MRSQLQSRSFIRLLAVLSVEDNVALPLLAILVVESVAKVERRNVEVKGHGPFGIASVAHTMKAQVVCKYGSGTRLK